MTDKYAKSFTDILDEMAGDITHDGTSTSRMKKAEYNGFDILFPCSAQISGAEPFIKKVIVRRYFESAITVEVEIEREGCVSLITYCDSPEAIGMLVMQFAQEVAKEAGAEMVFYNHNK